VTPYVTLFDRKFGADSGQWTTNPAVYLFRDEVGHVVYVGKAKNLRRRLQTYRNASRKKRHRKQRAIVQAAHTLEIQPQPSEAAALLRENELIRRHRPLFNVEGTYHFLYPAIAVGTHQQRLLLGITTDVEAWRPLNLRYFGVYRSRVRALEAFDALAALLSIVGHREPARRLPASYRPTRGARLHAYRRIGDLAPPLVQFLSGEALPPADRQVPLCHEATLSPPTHSPAHAAPLAALSPLVHALLEQRSAREGAQAIEGHLQTLARFERTDIAPLRAALAGETRGARGGTARTFVAQDARDALFIQYQAEDNVGAEP